MHEPHVAAKDLVKRYSAGERFFANVSLKDSYLDFENLSGLHLYAADLTTACLRFADLSRSRVVNCTLLAVSLGHANLRDADLSGANLFGADLTKTDFRDAVLRGALFTKADLWHTDFSGSDLRHAEFAGVNAREARFDGANMQRAVMAGVRLGKCSFRSTNLDDADLSHADCTEADFSGASLRGTNLSSTRIRGAKFQGARLGETNLANLNMSSLCDANPPIRHEQFSPIDYRSVVMTLDSPRLRQFMFLSGIPEVFIEYLIDSARAMRMNVLDPYRSVFISYGGPDEPFARRLYDALHQNRVHCFFFPVHAKPGQKIGRVMRDGISSYERIVIVCSRRSFERPGFLFEIEEAFDREAREADTDFLIPVTIDNYLLSNWLPSRPDITRALRARVVADFQNAECDELQFKVALHRLINALRK